MDTSVDFGKVVGLIIAALDGVKDVLSGGNVEDVTGIAVDNFHELTWSEDKQAIHAFILGFHMRSYV